VNKVKGAFGADRIPRQVAEVYDGVLRMHRPGRGPGPNR
jgi:hypothetical protein